MRHDAEKLALIQVDIIDRALREDFPVTLEVVRHPARHVEIVAKHEIQVRPVARDLLHGARIEVRVVHRVDTLRVGIPLHAEGERAARRPLGVERVLISGPNCRVTRAAVVHPVEIPRIRLQSCDGDFGRVVRGRIDGWRHACIRVGLVAVLDEHLRALVRQGVHGEGIGGRPAENDVLGLDRLRMNRSGDQREREQQGNPLTRRR